MTAVLEAEPLVEDLPVLEVLEAPVADDLPEEPLRETTPDDYVKAAGWGIASGIAAAAAAITVLPVQNLPLAFVLGAGLGVLGYLDQITHLIRNWHTAVFGTAAAVLIAATQMSHGGNVLLPALCTAAAAFVFILALALFLPGRFVGGGDIKLVPVPAALLAAISPLAALFWLQLWFIAALVGMVCGRMAGKRSKYLAMAPFMAIASVPALVTYGLLAPALGL